MRQNKPGQKPFGKIVKLKITNNPLRSMKNYARTVLLIICASLGVSAQAGLTLVNYQATVNAQNPNFYFTFDGGSLANTVGSLTPTLAANPAAVASQLTFDIFQNPSNCIYFSLSPGGNADDVYDSSESADHIISGGGVATNTSTAAGTITCLFRTPDPGPPSGSTTGPGAKCIFSAGSTLGTLNALYLQVENANATNNPNALTLGFGDSDTVLLPATNVVWDTWYYFALTYNEGVTNADGSPNTNKAAWYLGRLDGAGNLLTGKTINVTNAVAGDGADFVIGSQNTRNSALCKPGEGRVDEFATWSRQLSTNEIQAQFTNLPNPVIPNVSGYQTVISNQVPTHYFHLAGNTVDSMNPSLVLATNIGTILVTNPPFNTSVGYSYDYFLDQDGAAYFSIATDAIYTNANLLNGGGTYTGSIGTGQGSISGMFHGLPSTNWYPGEVYIFDAGGDTTSNNAFALLFEGPTNANPWSLKLRFGDSSGVMVPGTNILSEWYYFAITYDETVTNQQVHWWVGRPGTTLQSGFFSATNGSLAGEGDVFYIGNNTSDNGAFRYQKSSHTGNGQISQFTIWNRVLSTNEVTAQFNALTVQPPPPILNISLSGTNVILSWLSSTDPAFALQSTPSLSSPAWSGAGTPVVVGSNNVVTNAISPNNTSFYRLIK
jgi:hypothetical protein